MKTYSKSRKVTLRDVAKIAGVSTATVSRVINNPEKVKPRTLEKVRKVIEELHYSPNLIARSLKVQKSFMIGLLVPNILNPFFAKIARGTENLLNERGYTVLILDTQENSVKEAKYLKDLLERRVDGLIIVPSKEDTDIPKVLRKKPIPAVFVDRYFSKDFDSVKGNNFSGISLLVSHLVNRGYRRIGFISGPLETLPGRERYEAFIRLLALYGLEAKPAHVKISDFSIEGGYVKTKELLESGDIPEAVVAANNFMGVGALKAIREKGLRVPQDLGLVVFDEVFLADLADPPLTVVVQPAEEMGKVAAEMLLERIEAGEDLIPPREVVLEPVLIVRGSTF
jgi:LacI family transcriptional regulator